MAKGDLGAEDLLKSGAEALMHGIKMSFIITKKYWAPLLKGEQGGIQNPDNLSQARLKALNDRVAKIMFEEANKGMCMCSIDNGSLFGADSHIKMQILPMDNPELGTFSLFYAKIDLFTEKKWKELEKFPDFRDTLKPKKHKKKGEMDADTVRVEDEYPPMSISRFSGELHGIGLGTEALKLIAGNSASYELLRRDMLWYVSQLVCSRKTLERMWGDTFKAKEKTTFPPRPKDPQSSQDTPNPSTEIIRRYPSGDPDRQSPKGIISPEEVEGKVKEAYKRVQRLTEVVGHKRLLGLIKRKVVHPDGKVEIEITSPQPSLQAMKRAAESGITLGQGLEFISSGTVFRPQDVPEVLKEFGAESIEELIETFPGEVFVRYETWVPSFERGNEDHGKIKTVIAKVKSCLEGVLKKILP